MNLDRVREIVKGAGYGWLATSVDGQPQVRAMAFVLLDDGRLWSSTVNISGKLYKAVQYGIDTDKINPLYA